MNERRYDILEVGVRDCFGINFDVGCFQKQNSHEFCIFAS